MYSLNSNLISNGPAGAVDEVRSVGWLNSDYVMQFLAPWRRPRYNAPEVEISSSVPEKSVGGAIYSKQQDGQLAM